MLITWQMFQEALQKSTSLFHDGDEIDEQVYDALFINAHPSDDQCKKKQITTYGNRKILCSDMKVFRSERNPGDYVYYNTHCHLCGKETRISIRKNEIINTDIPFSRNTLIKNMEIGTKKKWLRGFITYKELYLQRYGLNWICKECAQNFIAKVNEEAQEMLCRPDRFDWFLAEENKEDWKQGLFRKVEHSYNPNSFEIFDVLDNKFQSEVYKKELKEKQIEEEKNKIHRERIEEIRQQRECYEKEEYLRVQRSNEEFLARHHILTPTQKYIQKFCKADSAIDIRNKDIIREALYPEGVEYEAVQKHNCMYYSEYLKTPLWRIISNRVKYNAKYKCEQCGINKDLETHHASYEFKGVEFLKIEDLSCLCRQCHQRIHEGKR